MTDETEPRPTPATIAHQRRAFTQAAGPLAAAFRDVLRQWDQWREASSRELDPAPMPSLEERVDGLERVLREVWPKGRVDPWHYICDPCRDTGWFFGVCTPDTPCGRPFRLSGVKGEDWTGRGSCALTHAFVAPCRCPTGQARRRALMKQPKAVQPDDYADAGKTTTAKPAKLGRW